MPRPPRCYWDGVPQHVYNRGNRRARIFQSADDYLSFFAAMARAAEKTTVRLCACCLMPNHWHLLVWPHVGSEVSTYVEILMNNNNRDLQTRHGTVGTGHIYQGRHKNVPVFTERHFYVAARYVEANPIAAGLVEHAEDWPWSSAAQRPECQSLLGDWPVPRPDNWFDLINQVPSNSSLKEMLAFARKARREARGFETAVWL